MLKQAIWLLGEYLYEIGAVPQNPAIDPVEFSNDTFSFTVDQEYGTTVFWYNPELIRAEWYLWVERGFNSSYELTAAKAFDLLTVCIASLQDEKRVFDDESGIEFKKVLDEWTPVDPEEDD